MQIVLTQMQIEQKIMRIAHQILENTSEEKTIYLAGICGNGIRIADKLSVILKANTEQEVVVFEIILDKENPWDHPIELTLETSAWKNGFIVLVDDVLNSGKTMQFALVKLLQHPTKAIKTVALVDRRHRRYPIKCDFVGITLSTTLKDRVEIDFENAPFAAQLV
jgi:pyrimidine operon attenuation protein/uracil phosphoribosyltransferase